MPTTSKAATTPPPSYSSSSSSSASPTKLPAAANSPYVLRTPQGRIRTIRKTTTVTKTTTATSIQTQTSTSTVTAACTTPPAPESTSSPEPPSDEQAGGGAEGGGTYLRCDTLVTFSLCDSNSCTPMGSVAPGTQCKDGGIVLATAQRLIKVRRGAVVGVPLRGGSGNSTVKLTERSFVRHELGRHS